jgi:molecular chaperone GrpE
MTKKATQKAEEKTKQEVSDQKEEVKETKENKTVQEEGDKASAKKADKQTQGQKKKTSEKAPKEGDLKEGYENKIAAAEDSAKDWQNKYMRLSAEFDNYRKRTLKEKTELTKTANGDLLKDILPVIDDFDRGRDNINNSDNIEGLKEGVELIYNKFSEFLRQNGVKEIEAKGEEFDIDFHEALTKIPAPSEDLKGKVVDVIEKGYTLSDKVIRYAKVVVGE